MKNKLYLIMVIFFTLPFASAAHYVVGYVQDAPCGEPANGKIVTLWNSTLGQSNNLTDVVGPNGNSGQDNFYLIDCELLSQGCKVGNILTVKIFNNGSGYFTNELNVTINNTGFSQAENLTFNAPLNVSLVKIEDDLSFPLNEIDLLPAITKTVTCSGILTDLDNETEIKNASATFFHTSKTYVHPDDKNNHYTNTSCKLNMSYGDSTETEATCSLAVEYYADYGSWNCTIEAFDIYNVSNQNSGLTTINGLLAIGVDSPIDYGSLSIGVVSEEFNVNVTNYGNIQINLSLNGYGVIENDNKAMNCTLSDGIPIQYEKYNLSASTPGDLNLSEFENSYTNLSSTPIVRSFNLNHRQDDVTNDALSSTYWRIYTPVNTVGNCSGSIIFGATQGPEI